MVKTMSKHKNTGVFKAGESYTTEEILSTLEPAFTDLISFLKATDDTGESMNTYGSFAVLALMGLFGTDMANAYLEDNRNRPLSTDNTFIDGLTNALLSEIIEEATDKGHAEKAKGEDVL